MKKIVLNIVIIISVFNIAKAQKGNPQTSVIPNPNNTVLRILPDLTFDLIPALVGGGEGFNKLGGHTNGIIVPINYIVKNIGLTVSKPCKVYAQINYQRPRTRVEIEQGISADTWLGFIISEPTALKAIVNGKDTLEKQKFVFNTIPADALGKRVRLTLKIEYGLLNGEQSSKNNQSDHVEFTLAP
jgi:hypothetical protein